MSENRYNLLQKIMDQGLVKRIARAWLQEKERYLTACGDYPRPEDYILRFDAAMDELISYSQTAPGFPQLGLAVAFSSTERRSDHSYRRVLKKYTRSIVFADLHIHLLLVREDQSLEVIMPGEVNAFLKNLNPYIQAKLKKDKHV